MLNASRVKNMKQTSRSSSAYSAGSTTTTTATTMGTTTTKSKVAYNRIKLCLATVFLVAWCSGGGGGGGGGVHALPYGSKAGEWKLSFDNVIGTELRVGSNAAMSVAVTIYDVDLTEEEDFFFEFKVVDTRVAYASALVRKSEFTIVNVATNISRWSGTVSVEGRHFGTTQLYASLHPTSGVVELSRQTLSVAVVRANALDNRIFSFCASILTMLVFANLGTALDLEKLRAIFLRPVGPFIGFCTRNILMPLLGLGIGYILFPNSVELQIAFFYTALAPSGTLANVSTVFLMGNLDLSVLVTIFNSVLSIGMIPLWLFLLSLMGHLTQDMSLSVSPLDLVGGTMGLILACMIGVLLRRFIPRKTEDVFRYLKPICMVLMLSIIGLTVGLNAYVFQELTGMIAFAALVLPIASYLLSFGFSKIFCVPFVDAMTIGVDTALVNMSVPILLLQYTLGSPRADMTMVVPIITALLATGVVIVILIARRLFGWNQAKTHPELVKDEVPKPKPPLEDKWYRKFSMASLGMQVVEKPEVSHC